MMYYFSGDATKVNVKTLETEQVAQQRVVCKIEDNTVHSFHVEGGQIEVDTMYLHKKSDPKLIELIPYLLEHARTGPLSMKGIRFQRGFDLVKLLQLSGWYEHIDTSIVGYKQYGLSCLGRNHIIGLNIYGDLVVKTTGKGYNNKEIVIPFTYASLNIKSLQSDTFFNRLSIRRMAKIEAPAPRGWKEDF